MNIYHRDQNGFGAIEVLLALILVAIIVFVGFYVANNRDSDKTSDTASSAKSSQDNSDSKAPASDTFTFKELGVRIPLSDTLKGLSYSVNTDISNEAYNVTTPEFTQLAAQCGDAPKGFADVFKEDGQAKSSNEGASGTLKQFDSYYIAYGDPLYGNQSCDQSVYGQLVDMQTKLDDALKTAFSTAIKL